MKVKSSPNRTVQLGFGSALIALTIVAGFSYRAVVESTQSEQWVAHSHKVLDGLQGLLIAMGDIESSSRAYVVTGDDSSLQSYAASKSSFELEENAVRMLTADNPEQQHRLPLLEQSAADKIEFADRLVSLRRIESFEAAIAEMRGGEGKRLMDTFQVAVRQLYGEELQLLRQRNTDELQHLALTKYVLIFGTVLGMLITAAAGWSVQRDGYRRRRAEEALRASEEQYRLVLQEIEDYAIFRMDSRGRVASWNAGAERIKGYRADEIIGQPYDCFFTPEDIVLGKPAEILHSAAERGRYEGQSMRVRKDGSRFLASVTITALRNAVGTLFGFSEFSHDLSESKEASAKYRGLLEAAPDAMVVVNQNDEIVLLNAQAEKQFGYRRDELVGQRVTNIIPEGFAERLVADGLRAKTDALEIGAGLELVGRRKDGSLFPIEIMLSPLENTEGVLVTAAIRDISTSKEAEAALHASEARFRTVIEAAEMGT